MPSHEEISFLARILQSPALVKALLLVLVALAASGLVFLVVSAWLSRSTFLSLSTTQAVQRGYVSPTYPNTLIGQQGIAQTPLHPAGKVHIGGTRYDAKTVGTYLAQGTPIVVVDTAGIALTVETAPSAALRR